MPADGPQARLSSSRGPRGARGRLRFDRPSESRVDRPNDDSVSLDPGETSRETLYELSRTPLRPHERPNDSLVACEFPHERFLSTIRDLIPWLSVSASATANILSAPPNKINVISSGRERSFPREPEKSMNYARALFSARTPADTRGAKRAL